jgi:hypothetical protein
MDASRLILPLQIGWDILRTASLYAAQVSGTNATSREHMIRYFWMFLKEWPRRRSESNDTVRKRRFSLPDLDRVAP